MTGYIIQPWDFSVVQAVNVTDYNLPLECFPGETGSVTFDGKGKRDYSQYIFRLDVLDTMWKITAAETGDAQSTKLTVADQMGILDGAIMKASFENSMYSATVDYWTLGGIIGGRNSTDLTDFDVQSNKYMYPYLRMNLQSYGQFETEAKWNSFLSPLALKTADYAIYSATSSGTRRIVTDVYKLVSALFTGGASIKFSLDKRRPNQSPGLTLALYVTLGINEGYSVATPVLFNDGHSFLLSESYDSDVCSCFIGIPSSPSSWPPPTENYVKFLDENLTIKTTNTNQINGYTKVEQCSSTTDANNKAKAAFDYNNWKHRVEFASDKILHLNQPVKLVLERGILNTAVSKVVIKSGDDRFYYTCGELPQTAAQHIKANSWRYGRRVPHNPYNGQLVFI